MASAETPQPSHLVADRTLTQPQIGHTQYFTLFSLPYLLLLLESSSIAYYSQISNVQTQLGMKHHSNI
jgi:hypothetical protein